MKLKIPSPFFVITLMSVLLTTGCLKKDRYLIGQKRLPKDFETLKKEFKQTGNSKYLQSEFADSLQLDWIPDWPKMSYKHQSDSIFYFIPLKPNLKNPRLTRKKYGAKISGFENFLIAGEDLSGELLFYKGSYVRVLTGKNETGSVNIDFRNFNGWALFDDFKGKKWLRYFISGVQQSPRDSIGKNYVLKTQSARIQPMSIVCSENCTWVSYCQGADIGDGDFTVTVTVGQSGSSCPMPTILPAQCPPYGGNSSGWQLSQTDQVNCFDTDNPTIPLPDPGTGGGGGNGDYTEEELKNFRAFTAKIGDMLTHPCLKDILGKIRAMGKGTTLGIMISKMDGNDPKWDWVLKEGKLGPNQNGQTVYENGHALTTLNYDVLKNATELSIARTIFHEAIHAHITMFFRNDPVTASLSYPEMVSAWIKAKYPDYNKIQHDQMVNYFVQDISEALHEYAWQNGYKIDYSVTGNLAWGGLDFWNNSVIATESKKQDIQARIDAEQTNKPNELASPVGKATCN